MVGSDQGRHRYRAELERLSLSPQQIDLYQDGLPVCGRELEIVQKAAAAGSDNYQLLLDLVSQGAHLFGTEDPQLLLAEYHHMKTALGGPSGATQSSAPAGETTQYKQTLSQRDAYIGRRIGQSLRPGRTGILFLGMMHNVEPFLPADIVVTRLVPPGLERKGKATQCPQSK